MQKSTITYARRSTDRMSLLVCFWMMLAMTLAPATASTAMSSSMAQRLDRSRTGKLDRLKKSSRRLEESREGSELRRITTIDWDEAARKKSKKSCGKGDSTCAPSESPSDSPSAFPTTSVAPSVTPSQLPSQVPTVSPSDQPSFTPSVAPSRLPSVEPSQVPSFAPSVSQAPTPIVFTLDSANGLVSTCNDKPPVGEGTIREQTLAFQYNLYLTPEANFADEINNLESILHLALSIEFLKCQYDVPASFLIVEVAADPSDSLASGACDTTNDPALAANNTCGVVNAEFTMKAFFPSSRRHLRSLQGGVTDASPEVLTATGNYLDAAMAGNEFVVGNILQVSFQGFLNSVAVSGGETPEASETENGVAGAVGQINNPPSNLVDNTVALGGAVVGLAAVVLSVILYVGARRRRDRQVEYLKHLEDLSLEDVDLNEDSNALGDVGKVELVRTMTDDSSDSLDDMVLQLDAAERAKHDSRRCASATCPLCRQSELSPTFIQTIPQFSVADLRRMPVVRSETNRQRISDTVDL